MNEQWVIVGVLVVAALVVVAAAVRVTGRAHREGGRDELVRGGVPVAAGWCVCGEPSAAGTIHRTYGPCYVPARPVVNPATRPGRSTPAPRAGSGRDSRGRPTSRRVTDTSATGHHHTALGFTAPDTGGYPGGDTGGGGGGGDCGGGGSI